MLNSFMSEITNEFWRDKLRLLLFAIGLMTALLSTQYIWIGRALEVPLPRSETAQGYLQEWQEGAFRLEEEVNQKPQPN